MQQQIQEGITEEVPPKSIGEVLHYVPHHPVVHKEVESTKLGIVYNCSAKRNCDQPPFNDFLESRPSLQPFLFDNLFCNRMRHQESLFTDSDKQRRHRCTTNILV